MAPWHDGHIVPSGQSMSSYLGSTMRTYHSRVGVTSRLRMRDHDYASPASYLITICTEQRLPLLGSILDGELALSPAGIVIDSWWHFLPARILSVELDAAVVMPNHFHAIVHLGTDPDREAAPLLGQIVRWFKRRTTYDYTIGVKTEGWSRFPGRLWQEQYYDRIIRDERGLELAREYVIGNPGKWLEDDYFQP
jgi:REP element-mobilizing transposase RayT